MKLVILDRDGVINYDSPNSIKSLSEWQPIPGSLEAIAKLTHHHFSPVIITNQSGIGKKLYTVKTLELIHQQLQNQLAVLNSAIETILYCPHVALDNCACRKPKVGLYEQVEKIYNRSLKGVWAVGDSYRDLIAANQMGCQFILVKTGNGAQMIKNGLQGLVVCNNLSAAAEHIISHP